MRDSRKSADAGAEERRRHDAGDPAAAVPEVRLEMAELAYLVRLATLGDLVSSLAHQLSQPLAAILNYARGCGLRLESGSARPEDLSPVLEKIAEQALGAAEGLARLRKFARQDAAPPAQCDLNLLVRDVAGMVEADVRAAGVTMSVDLQPNLPAVGCEPMQITQVVLGLVRNSLRKLRDVAAESRRLVLRTTRCGTDAVEVVVADSGTPGAVTDLFADRPEEPSALALGLRVGRAIIEAHGGRLACGADGGNTVRLILPRAQAATDV